MAGKNRVLLALLKQATKELKDQIRFLGNCPPSLPLRLYTINTYFSLRTKRWLSGGVGGQFPRNLYTSKNGIWARKYGRIRVLGKCMEVRPHFVP